jgi:hypothetical protein
MSIIKNLTSKDLKEQQEGIDQIKKILLHFEPVSEHIIISFIPSILELGSEKRLQLEIELLSDDIVKKINPYAFELIFKQISQVFVSVKF